MSQATARSNRAARLAPRQHAHSFLNITALPSTPSPSLLHSNKIKERKQRYKGSKKPPSLPTLQQENSTFDSMRMSSSINEIPSCIEESSSSTSCEKLFSSHSYHANSSSDMESSKRERIRPLSGEYSSRFRSSRNSPIGVQINASSPPLSSSPIHGRGGNSIPFISTLPPIASSPLPPSTPISNSPYPPSSPILRTQSSYGNSLCLPNSTPLVGGQRLTSGPSLLSPATSQIPLCSVDSFAPKSDGLCHISSHTTVSNVIDIDFINNCKLIESLNNMNGTSIEIPPSSLSPMIPILMESENHGAFSVLPNHDILEQTVIVSNHVSSTSTNAVTDSSIDALRNPSLLVSNLDSSFLWSPSVSLRGLPAPATTNSDIEPCLSNDERIIDSSVRHIINCCKDEFQLSSDNLYQSSQFDIPILALAPQDTSLTPNRHRESSKLIPSVSKVSPSTIPVRSAAGTVSPPSFSAYCNASQSFITSEPRDSSSILSASPASANKFSSCKLSDSNNVNTTSVPLNASSSGSGSSVFVCSSKQKEDVIVLHSSDNLQPMQDGIYSETMNPSSFSRVHSKLKTEINSDRNEINDNENLSTRSKRSSLTNIEDTNRNSEVYTKKSHTNDFKIYPIDLSKFDQSQKLIAFQKSRDRITAFQKNLQPYEPSSKSHFSPEVSSRNIPNIRTSPSTVNRPKSSGSVMSYLEQSTASQILDSKLCSVGSPRTIKRATSIRTSPHFRYINKHSCHLTSIELSSSVGCSNTIATTTSSVLPIEDNSCSSRSNLEPPVGVLPLSRSSPATLASSYDTENRVYGVGTTHSASNLSNFSKSIVSSSSQQQAIDSHIINNNASNDNNNTNNNGLE